MIEAGVAGGSASIHAEQRRNVANRLVAEAQWLDTVAADERVTAAQLSELPTTNAILHDLKLEGQQGNIDHLVVGPGGAFVVLTRRFVEPMAIRDAMLYAGDRSLLPEVDGARAVAERLGEVIGVAVVPIIGFHGGILPAAAPQQIDGVYVTAVESLVRVIARAAHTVLPAHKITEISERAITMLFNPGSVARSQNRPGQSAAPVSTPTVGPWIPEPAGPAPTRASADDAALEQATMGILRTATTTPPAAEVPAAVAQLQPLHSSQPVPPTPAFQPVPPVPPLSALSAFAPGGESHLVRPLDTGAKAPTSLNELSQMASSAGQAVAPATPAPATPGVHGRRHSRGLTITLVLSLCLVAATLGAAIAIMQNHGDDTSAVDGPTATTVTAGSTGTSTAGALADGVAAPLVSFSAVCPSPGSGWSWVADWPGDLDGLTEYDVEFQNPDGTWTNVAPLISAAVTTVSVAGQPPSSTLVFRITALMQDGSRSVNQEAAFTTPASPC